MEQLLVGIVLGLFGLGLGSFAGAMVWRLRARQLVEDKAAGESVDNKELKQLLSLTRATFTTDRSHCLHCHHPLAWYDLLPLVSWMSTKGECRYCQAKIGWFEPIIELSVAVVFVISYLVWPDILGLSLFSTLQFALWLGAVVLLAILFAYDLKWFLLPNLAMFPLIGIAAAFALLEVVGSQDIAATILNIFFAIAILSGMYLLLWVMSKGRWIGFGDVKLGLALALLLADWKLAFVALFAANLVGCLVVAPGLITGKLTRSSRVPFGPLLIIGGVFAMLFGDSIVSWYLQVLL
jgi:prepilin signal peptidase PulO-like enzyme (type II secretory pathway)